MSEHNIAKINVLLILELRIFVTILIIFAKIICPGYSIHPKYKKELLFY